MSRRVRSIKACRCPNGRPPGEGVCPRTSHMSYEKSLACAAIPSDRKSVGDAPPQSERGRGHLNSALLRTTRAEPGGSQARRRREPGTRRRVRSRQGSRAKLNARLAFAAAATERSGRKQSARRLPLAGERARNGKKQLQNLASRAAPPGADCPLGGFSGAEKVSNLPSKGSPSLVSD